MSLQSTGSKTFTLRLYTALAVIAMAACWPEDNIRADDHGVKSGENEEPLMDPMGNTSSHSADGHVERYHIATFDWHHVDGPMIVTLWLLLASLFKIGFHMSNKFASIFPDSSLLIVLGLVLGVILNFTNLEKAQFILQSDIFFLFLLPPIVFDAGYFMPSRAFFDNLGTILVYAVIGTIWNTMAIGFSLWAIGLTGLFHLETPLLHVLLFTSLISAVDPVAVLVVFEEIHVNELLYITVFGESLLNDAVTVVLYKMFESFSAIGESNILPVDIISGLASFLVVAFGGILVGVAFAIVVSTVTRLTQRVRVLEPLFIFSFAYCSYLTAEMFHLSGILAIVFCGICMKQYVKANMSQKSQTTVKYFLKMLSSSCETIIFMFLGLSTVSAEHVWDTAFVCLTVLFCLIYRAIGTLVLTYFVNKQRLVQLNKVEQFIMAYGGLRGAVAYGLVVALNESIVPGKKMFVTATIVVIYFTVFFQGMTIKPLVNLLKVRKDEKHDKTMNEQIFDRVSDHMLAGMEDLMGHYGHHWIRDKWEYYNMKLIRPLLMNVPSHSAEHSILQTFTKLNMKDAMEYLNQHGSFHTNNPDSLANILRQASFQKMNASGNSLTDNPISTCLDMNAIDVMATGAVKYDDDAHDHHMLRGEVHHAHHAGGQPAHHHHHHGHEHTLETLETLEELAEAIEPQSPDDVDQLDMHHHHQHRRYSRQMVEDEPLPSLHHQAHLSIRKLMHERGRQKAETARKLVDDFTKRGSLEIPVTPNSLLPAPYNKKQVSFVGDEARRGSVREDHDGHLLNSTDAAAAGRYLPKGACQQEENFDYITFTVPSMQELVQRRHSSCLTTGGAHNSAPPSGGQTAPIIFDGIRPTFIRHRWTQTGDSLNELQMAAFENLPLMLSPVDDMGYPTAAEHVEAEVHSLMEAGIQLRSNKGLLLEPTEDELTAVEKEFPWKRTDMTPTRETLKKGLYTEPVTTARSDRSSPRASLLQDVIREEDDPAVPPAKAPPPPPAKTPQSTARLEAGIPLTPINGNAVPATGSQRKEETFVFIDTDRSAQPETSRL